MESAFKVGGRVPYGKKVAKEESKKKRSRTSFKFQKADTNGDGKLSVEEYQRILQDHNIECVTCRS